MRFEVVRDGDLRSRFIIVYQSHAIKPDFLHTPVRFIVVAFSTQAIWPESCRSCLFGRAQRMAYQWAKPTLGENWNTNFCSG